MPGCPVRFRPGTGPDRPCAMHRDDDGGLATRMERFGEAMAAPGEHDGGDTGQAATLGT